MNNTKIESIAELVARSKLRLANIESKFDDGHPFVIVERQLYADRCTELLAVLKSADVPVDRSALLNELASLHGAPEQAAALRAMTLATLIEMTGPG